MSAFDVTRSVAAEHSEQADGQVLALVAELDRLAGENLADTLSDDALQALMAAVVALYAQKAERRGVVFPVDPGARANATAVLMATTGLLKGSNLQLFELGMWQSWSGMK